MKKKEKRKLWIVTHGLAYGPALVGLATGSIALLIAMKK